MASEIFHGNRAIPGTFPLTALVQAVQDKINGALTQAQLDARINQLIDGAGAAFDTLNELADALNNDPNFAATIASQLAGKANINGETGFPNLLAVGNELRRLAGVSAGTSSYTTGFNAADLPKLTNPANWDVAGDGNYTGPALVTTISTFSLVRSTGVNVPNYRFETDGSSMGAVRFIGV